MKKSKEHNFSLLLWVTSKLQNYATESYFKTLKIILFFHEKLKSKTQKTKICTINTHTLRVKNQLLSNKIK